MKKKLGNLKILINSFNFYLYKVMFFNTEMERSKLNSMIESAICNNYYAILERLNYFQNKLNHILFNSYIPMGVVHLIFQH
jgi:hypothetical protein